MAATRFRDLTLRLGEGCGYSICHLVSLARPLCLILRYSTDLCQADFSRLALAACGRHARGWGVNCLPLQHTSWILSALRDRRV